MERPEEVQLSREEGEALRTRLAGDALTAADRRVLDQVLQWYFWLLFALQEATFSLKRLRALLFGDKPKKRQSPSSSGSSDGSDGAGDVGAASTAVRGTTAEDHRSEGAAGGHRPGHGRQGAAAYPGAERVTCRHETLAVGERCPVCGQGRLYAVPPGVDIRIDGNALLSAIHYELEKLRCSACGQVFTAQLPAETGMEKYRPRARAVLALGRYYLGLPFYRVESYQAMLGVPVPDATQWDQIERVADCGYVVFAHLERLAAQGELIYQDDTRVRILSLIEENQRAQAHAEAMGVSQSSDRTGMYTTALVVQAGERTICLYYCGRAHAGENLEALLTKREADRGKPLVMSDALPSNAADEATLIRCHCLAHGRRKFSDLEDVFPQECQVVIEALKQVFDHDEHARQRAAEPRGPLGVPPGLESSDHGRPQTVARHADRRSSGGTQQLVGQGHCVYAGPLGAPDTIFGDCRRSSGQQSGRAGLEVVHSAAQELAVLQNGVQRLHCQCAHQSDCYLHPRGCQCPGLPGGVAGAPRRGLCQPRGVVALELSRKSGPALGDATPIVGHVSALRIAIPQHNDQLPRGQGHPYVRSRRPPGKAPLR